MLWWPKATLDVEWGLLFALWLSQPSQWQGLLPSYCSRSPQIRFWAVVWGSRGWSMPRERSPWVFLLRSSPPGSAFCAVTRHPSYGLTKYTVVGTALSPTSTVRMQAVSPGVPQALCSQSHQHRSAGNDPLKWGSRTTVVTHLNPLLELSKQCRLQPSLCVHAPTNHRAAKARLVPATGAPIVHLDVLQALSIQSQWLWGRSAQQRAEGSDISPASACGQPAGTLPELLQVAPSQLKACGERGGYGRPVPPFHAP